MKFLFKFYLLLLSLAVLPQATPPQYPYPDPLPTSGTISSGFSIQVGLVLNPTSYSDARPTVWDDFIGGGYRSVLSTAERDSIIAGRRKEGMLVWVAADNHTYKLASNLTSWTDLGILAAGGSATTLYNGNSSLSGNRVVTGAGFNLDFVGLGIFTSTAATSITLSAPTVSINGGSFTRINNTGPYPFLFAAAPSVAGQTHELLARNPSTGEVTFTPNATIGGASGLYRGVTSGTPGTWVAATSTLTPAYSSASQPPEATVAVLKFPSNSVGSDTLQLGDNTTGIPITRADGTTLQADDIVAGQHLLLTRSGTTSGSHWTLQPLSASVAPSPSTDVVSVDTADGDLAGSTADLVITRGYFTEGDGGHGAYRRDPASSDTIDNVTVWDCTAGGRYLLMVSGAISAKQAGAVGDGVADDGPALQALLDACPNLAARLEPLSYLTTGGLIIPENVRVIANGATITANTSGNDDRALDFESNTQWIGGGIHCHRVSGGNDGEDHVAIRIGAYTGNSGSSNVVIRNVTLSTDWSSDFANVLVIQSASHDVTIDNVTVEDSSTIRAVIACHWGFVDGGNEVNGTLHPHNLKISNIKVGALTAGSGDVTPIAVSACYNVDITNVRCKQARFGMQYVCGDFGFTYSGFQGQQLGGVSFNNVFCELALLVGGYFVGVDSNAVVWPLNGSVNNCTFIGANNGGGLGGTYFDSAVGVVLNNCVIAGHEYGNVLTNGCSSLTFNGGLFATNRITGFLASDPDSKNVTVRGVRFQNNARGASGTNASAIRLIAGENFRIIDNDIGNAVSEPNQEVGILCIPPAVNMTITGNNVVNVKSGGIDFGLYLGNSADSGHLWVVANNQSTATTLISGPQVIPYLVRGTKRTWTGAATPTVGTFLVGERLTLDAATSTPFERVVTVAGSPGTWADSY